MRPQTWRPWPFGKPNPNPSFPLPSKAGIAEALRACSVLLAVGLIAWMSA